MSTSSAWFGITKQQRTRPRQCSLRVKCTGRRQKCWAYIPCPFSLWPEQAMLPLWASWKHLESAICILTEFGIYSLLRISSIPPSRLPLGTGSCFLSLHRTLLSCHSSRSMRTTENDLPPLFDHLCDIIGFCSLGQHQNRTQLWEVSLRNLLDGPSSQATKESS